MKDILLVIEKNLPIVITVVAIVLLAIIGMIVFLSLRRNARRKSFGTEVRNTQNEITLPQNTAYTLMTEDTLELEASDSSPAFSVEYEITFIYSNEVI